jgi:hypothetical protein
MRRLQVQQAQRVRAPQLRGSTVAGGGVAVNYCTVPYSRHTWLPVQSFVRHFVNLRSQLWGVAMLLAAAGGL